MFAQNQTDQLEAAALASQHMKSWEKILGLRISLQKSLDVGNQLPAENMTEMFGLDSDSSIAQSTKLLCKGLQSVLTELVEVSNVQAENINDKYRTSNNKRKRSNEVSWEDVVAPQDTMTPYWESVVNKWHARLNFGSEQAKSKLKVFNQSIWDQVSNRLQLMNPVSITFITQLCYLLSVHHSFHVIIDFTASTSDRRNFVKRISSDREESRSSG
jgi:hypothetical protein